MNEDTKIYLIIDEDENGKPIVSHGVGNVTLQNYVLPWQPPSYFSPLKDGNGLYLKVE